MSGQNMQTHPQTISDIEAGKHKKTIGEYVIHNEIGIQTVCIALAGKGNTNGRKHN